MLAKIRVINAQFRKLVDHLEDLCGYIERNDKKYIVYSQNLIKRDYKILCDLSPLPDEIDGPGEPEKEVEIRAEDMVETGDRKAEFETDEITPQPVDEDSLEPSPEIPGDSELIGSKLAEEIENLDDQKPLVIHNRQMGTTTLTICNFCRNDPAVYENLSNHEYPYLCEGCYKHGGDFTAETGLDYTTYTVNQSLKAIADVI